MSFEMLSDSTELLKPVILHNTIIDTTNECNGKCVNCECGEVQGGGDCDDGDCDDDGECGDDGECDDESCSTCNDECDNNPEDISNNYTNFKNKTILIYNEIQEIQNEINIFNEHLFKNTGSWLSAKTIISNSVNNISNTEYLWDYLDILFKNNNDDFDNIQSIIYSSNGSIFEFNNTTISKFIVDNLKICKFKSIGYIFNNNNENNIFNFKLVVITNKNIYPVNRYIDENKLGYY
jgi:hypothetical protein